MFQETQLLVPFPAEQQNIFLPTNTGLLKIQKHSEIVLSVNQPTYLLNMTKKFFVEHCFLTKDSTMLPSNLQKDKMLSILPRTTKPYTQTCNVLQYTSQP